MELKSLNDLVRLAKSRPSKKVAVVAAEDSHVIKALLKAKSENIIEPVLLGDHAKILISGNSVGADLSRLEIIDLKDPSECVMMAIKLIREGNANMLMKGRISTAPLLRAVLDKDRGLKNSELLSHFALIQTSKYHKLLGISDAAMNIAPGVNEKKIILQNACKVYHKLGIACPKVAVITPLESVNEKIQSTVDAAELTSLNRNNLISGCRIEGPLALDNAISKAAAACKGINSDVAGDADMLLVPDLNSGNILYKSLVFLSDGISAAIITGATVPIVLTSRADSDQSKFYSLALAAALD